MFSSNHPIPGFNRPASLYVIDGVVNVPIELDVSIENRGTTPSPVTDVRLLVLHDEYQRFEIVNMTEPLNSVSGASSGTVKFQFTPTYAGNHSLQVNILSATPDDNPSNDERNSRMTVGASIGTAIRSKIGRPRVNGRSAQIRRFPSAPRVTSETVTRPHTAPTPFRG